MVRREKENIEDAAGLMNDEALNDNAEKRIRNERGGRRREGVEMKLAREEKKREW
jgi:hypothetical protein